MRRKLWAIGELFSVLKGYSALFFRAHLIWSVHTDAKTRQERMDDIRYQIDGTPLKYEQSKLERRLDRVFLALIWPQLDRLLLSIERLLPPGDSEARRKYHQLEDLIFKTITPKEKQPNHDH